MHLKMVFQYCWLLPTRVPLALLSPIMTIKYVSRHCLVGGAGGDKVTPVGNQQSKLIIVVPLFLPLINLDIGM